MTFVSDLCCPLHLCLQPIRTSSDFTRGLMPTGNSTAPAPTPVVPTQPLPSRNRDYNSSGGGSLSVAPRGTAFTAAAATAVWDEMRKVWQSVEDPGEGVPANGTLNHWLAGEGEACRGGEARWGREDREWGLEF